MNKIITESEFRAEWTRLLDKESEIIAACDYVTGPGRSGAIAAVYASHHMAIPFVPFKHVIPDQNVLIVDTASRTGRTIRKATNYYLKGGKGVTSIIGYPEGPKEHLRFWYEELSIIRGKGNEYQPL